MKYVCGYWLICCLLIGIALGKFGADCPNEIGTVSGTQIATLVLTWPVYLVAAATMPRSGPAHLTCPGASK